MKLISLYTSLEWTCRTKVLSYIKCDTHAILFQENLPNSFDEECVLTTGYLINRTISNLLHGKSPFKILHGISPYYNLFVPLVVYAMFMINVHPMINFILGAESVFISLCVKHITV